MKLNTNSNVYTIVYATIVVIIVAVLLALVSQVLSPRQAANVKLDQQKQMLVALNQELGPRETLEISLCLTKLKGRKDRGRIILCA